VSRRAEDYRRLLRIARDRTEEEADPPAVLPSEPATTEPLPSQPATELPTDNTTLLPSNNATKSEGERNVHWAQLNTRVKKHLYEQMEIYRFLHKMTIRQFIEGAIATKLQSNQATKQQRIDLDPDDALKDEDILLFYRRWTGNQVTEKDRHAFKEVEHLHPNIVKAGILISIIRAKTRINSFRYCIGAIQEAADSPVKPDGDYIRYLLGRVGEGK
jgi:hypothetical protein